MARPAYVLPETAVAGTDAVNLPGFPGIWTPGQPIAAAELVAHGNFADEDELADRVAELALPLELVEVTGAEGAMPMPANHVASRAEAIAEAVEDTPRPRSKRQAEKLAADRGIVFSSDDLSLAEMNAEIFADVVADEQPAQPDEPAEPEETG